MRAYATTDQTTDRNIQANHGRYAYVFYKRASACGAIGKIPESRSTPLYFLLPSDCHSGLTHCASSHPRRIQDRTPG